MSEPVLSSAPGKLLLATMLPVAVAGIVAVVVQVAHRRAPTPIEQTIEVRCVEREPSPPPPAPPQPQPPRPPPPA